MKIHLPLTTRAATMAYPPIPQACSSYLEAMVCALMGKMDKTRSLVSSRVEGITTNGSPA